MTGVSWRLKSGEIRWLSTLDGRIIMPFRKDYSSVDSVDQPVLVNPDKTDLQPPPPPPPPATGAASATRPLSLSLSLLPLASPPRPLVAVAAVATYGNRTLNSQYSRAIGGLAGDFLLRPALADLPAGDRSRPGSSAGFRPG